MREAVKGMFILKKFYIKLLSIIIIFLSGILIYSNTFFCSFHFDDSNYIVNNFYIRNIHNLQSIWKICPCRFLTFLSIAFDYHFHRLDVFAYHLFNITVHVGSAILVWWLTLLTFSTPAMKEEKIARHAKAIALFAGLIFVSNPVQIEAVTYIWQRAASMAAFFYLGSLGLYVKSRLLQDNKSTFGLGRFYYIFSLITAVAAMFTKENSITLPLMILLYEFSFFGARKGQNLKYLFPFLLTLFIIPLTMLFTKSFRFQEIQGVVEGPEGISPLHYLLTQFRVMITYIRLVFLPLNLNLDYDYPIYKNIFELPVLISFAFLITILYIAKSLFSKYRLISFSIFWFFLTLLPESSLLPQKDVIFEHRLYLPLVGYSMFLVSGAYTIFGKNYFKTMMVVLTMIVACYSVMTYQRNKVWKDELSLGNDIVQKSPHKARPYYNRGLSLYNQDKLAQAMSDYNKAIEIDPKLAEAYDNRGVVYDKQEKFTQAISDYNRAIEIDPNYARAYYNRGLSFYTQGNLAQAMFDYNKAIEINPNYAEAYDNRGVVYYMQDKYPQALSEYNRAIEIDPKLASAYIDRGVYYDNQGHLPQAISDYNKATEIDPKLAKAYKYRGLIYYKQGNFTKALSEYDKAIEIDPNDAEVYNDRGSFYGNQDNLTQAMSNFDKAIERNPKYADAYKNRAFGYYALNKYVSAWADVRKAEGLGAVVNPDFINNLKKVSRNNAAP